MKSSSGFVTNIGRSQLRQPSEPHRCGMVMTDVDTILYNSPETRMKDDFANIFPDSSHRIRSVSRVSGYQTTKNKDNIPLRRTRKKRSTVSKKREIEATIEVVKPKLKALEAAKNTNDLKMGRIRKRTNKSSMKKKENTISLRSPKNNAVIAHNTDEIVNEHDTTQMEELNDLPDIVMNSETTKSTKVKKSRSSTMPGLAYRSTMRTKAYEDGLDIAETKSGKKIRSSAALEMRSSKVTKRNSEQMYISSASVPDSLIRFVDEIHKESRISPQEEKELGSKTQEAIRIQNVYEDLENSLNRKPTDAEYCAAAGKINIEALRQTIEEGLEAKNRLVTSNLRMVQRVVNLYLRNGLGSEYNAGDLMQDGTIVSTEKYFKHKTLFILANEGLLIYLQALIRAAEKYEPQRGFRFSTYAMYWIRSSVKRSQILQSRVIDVPQRLHENYKKIQKTIRDYETTHGRTPDVKEIAEEVNLSEVQVERCVKALEQRIYSLDAEITNPLKGGSGMKNDNNRKETMYNLIQNQFDNVEMAELESNFLKEDLIRSLRKHITPHEVDLLLLRYGLIDEKTLPHGFGGPLTISEVSRLVGIKPDKVRRTLNNSLRQLRHVIGEEWEREAL